MSDITDDIKDLAEDYAASIDPDLLDKELGMRFPIPNQLTKKMIAAHAKLTDDSLREALGKWVSEVEPEIVCNAKGGLLGIGALGHKNPIVPIRPVNVCLTYNGERI